MRHNLLATMPNNIKNESCATNLAVPQLEYEAADGAAPVSITMRKRHIACANTPFVETGRFDSNAPSRQLHKYVRHQEMPPIAPGGAVVGYIPMNVTLIPPDQMMRRNTVPVGQTAEIAFT